jgi:sterol desaturase/sphingolipid hydroxylase (fatty acid hydroxylase superfamily)
MALYEIVHFLCHSKIVSKNKLLKKIVLHHVIHHDKKQMQHYNFAIVFPIVDTFFKTRKKTL